MEVCVHGCDRLIVDGKLRILKLSLDSNRFFSDEESIIIRFSDSVVVVLSHSTGQKLLDSLCEILPKRIENGD